MYATAPFEEQTFTDHLYERYGFVREGLVTRDMLIRGEFVDNYTMGLQIDPPETK
jgi:RimJ/RimL family protein N-acetyltransferase